MTVVTRSKYLLPIALALVAAVSFAYKDYQDESANVSGYAGALEEEARRVAALPRADLYFAEADCRSRPWFASLDVSITDPQVAYLARDLTEYLPVHEEQATITAASVLSSDGCANYEEPFALPVIDALALRYDGE